MNEPSRPRGRKLFAVLAIFWGLALLLVGLFVGTKIGRHGMRSLINFTGGPPKFSAAAWAPRTIQDVTVEAPFEFGPGPDISAQLPPQVRDAISYMQIYQGSGTPKTFVAMLSRIGYKPGTPTSLDGAVAGAMKYMGAAIGDPKPKYAAAAVTVSGLQGRKVSYHRQASGQTVNIDSVFAMKEQKLWQLQVIYQHPESAGAVNRMIQSLKITP